MPVGSVFVAIQGNPLSSRGQVLRPGSGPTATERVPGTGIFSMVSRRSLFLLVLVGYAGGAVLALVLAEHSGLSAVFFLPAGLVVAALLRTERSSWWVVVLAAAMAEMVVNLVSGLSAPLSIGFSIANVTGPLAGAVVVTQACGKVDLAKTRHVIWFLLGSVVVGSLLAGSIGAATVVFFGTRPPLEVLWQWWLGDGLGVVLIGSLLLSIDSGDGRVRLSSLPGVGMMVGWVVLSFAIFGFSDLPIGFFVLIGVIMAGVVFGTRAVSATSVLLATTLVVIGSLAEGGLLNWEVIETDQLLLLKAQLAVFTAAGLYVAAEVSERIVITRKAADLRASAELHEVERRSRLHSERLAEQALRSEERYRSLIEQTDDGVFLIGADGRFLEVAPAGEARLGYGTGELSDIRFVDIFAVHDRAKVSSIVEGLAVGEMDRREWSLRRRDGSGFDAEVIVRRTGEEQLQVIIHDVTARNQLWAALRRSEARFHTLFSSIDEGYCLAEMVLDDQGRPVDYRFLVTNPRFEAMTGLVDAAGHTARELVDGLEDHWVETYAQVALGGQTTRFEQGSEAMGRWFDVFAAPVEPRGQFVLVFTDITARRNAELDLRRSEERFRLLADRLPLLIWQHDSDGNQVFVNETFCAYFGVERSEMSGVKWRALTHPDDGDAYASGFLDAVSERRSFHGEVRVRRSDGEWRWLESWADPLFGPDGSYEGHIGSSADVTVRKEMEAAAQEAADDERRARGRIELVATVLTSLESVAGVRGRLDRLVELLVPRVADVALVEELPGRSLLAAAHTMPLDEWDALKRQIRSHGALSQASHGLVENGSVADGVRSLVAFPIDLGGGIQATMTLALVDSDRRPYDDRDVTFLGEIVERAGLLVANARALEEEHHVAFRLQRALLPDGLARHSSVEVGARYQAAGEGLEVGGDWFESFNLSDGLIGFAVGDVVGHGLDSAVGMGRLRAAMGALAPMARGPGDLLSSLDRFAVASRATDFATACCAVVDTDTGRLTYASAGHPPILVVSRDGEARWLEDGRSPPLGTLAGVGRTEASIELSEQSMVVLYSDGLVERRSEPIDVGLQRLEQAVIRNRHVDPGELCSILIDEMALGAYDDDVVVVCVRLLSTESKRFNRRIPADPHQLAGLRADVRKWLEGRHVPGDHGADLLLALGEASANAVEHAYAQDGGGDIEIAITDSDTFLEVCVADAGSWRAPSIDDMRGRGLGIIERLSSEIRREIGPNGTVVTFTIPTVQRLHRLPPEASGE
jgi:PAS domain S-box-containing protein